MKKKHVFFTRLNYEIREILFEEMNDANIYVVGLYIDKLKTAIVYDELDNDGFQTKSLLLVNKSKE